MFRGSRNSGEDHRSGSTTSFPTRPFPDMLSSPSFFKVTASWQGKVRCREGLPTALTEVLSLAPYVAHPFQHHLFEVAIAQRVAQVPPYAQQNDLGFEMTPLERTLIAHEGNSSPGLE